MWCVVTNNIEGKYYDWVGDSTFSPDNMYLVYAAKQQGKFFMVIDGNESKKYDRIMVSREVTFDSAGNIYYFVSEGNYIYSVKEEPNF
ncbi:MAG: hypothetical protein Q8N76_03115 [Candidatus Omnitrophota bacterium]|nr:hypothetical protein [Candidatus Omnitrophota bacterium]